jgi:predicted negative regulator of RcsB-dependent stress response
MKNKSFINGNSNGNGNGKITFGFVLLAIILLIIIVCMFGWFCWNKKKESFIDERFFHYNDINNIVPNDPIHVNRDIVNTALMNGKDISNYFGSAKKKTIK